MGCAEALLGPVFDRVYVNEHGHLRQAPDIIPKTIRSLLGIALTKLANRYAKEMKLDGDALDETYKIMQKAAARPDPY